MKQYQKQQLFKKKNFKITIVDIFSWQNKAELKYQ